MIQCESKLQRICNEEGQLKAQINKLSEEYGRLESDEKVTAIKVLPHDVIE